MPSKNSISHRIEDALESVQDEASFIQNLLVRTLDWPIESDVEAIEEITYEWSTDELKAEGLSKKIAEGRVRQLAMPNCPWGVFLVEFKNPEVFKDGRGMTGPLRQVLRGLVPRQRKAAHLPSFQRDHLLFICTYNFTHFRFAYFKDPGEEFQTPPLASFGWHPGDSTKTVSTYNLPHLEFLADDASVDDWIEQWAGAFDVERVAKKFYTEYRDLHDSFRDKLKGVDDASDRIWLASIILNRLMFVYFLQKKGFIDGGNLNYLEEKLHQTQKRVGKNACYKHFLTLLFFEGFAKPEQERSTEARKYLGDIHYLNGGLFLPHPLEQDAEDAGVEISLPDAPIEAALKFFASYSWNLNDIPGGEDNEINPDVLGYILEKYINQKSFGAYYTRPEITRYLCERTIHRLVLDAINTPEDKIESIRKAGHPVRRFEMVGQLLKKLDDRLCARLLDEVLPDLKLLDPACGSGAFLVAAMKTLIDIYAAIYSWMEFHGNAQSKSVVRKIRKDHPSLDYHIKKRIITDNLFGVDIMNEAVEIARLRLFLALVASADKVDDLEPLPNIDFNILQGNSLIGLLEVDPNGFDAKNLFLPPYQDVLRERDLQLNSYRHAASFTKSNIDLIELRDKIAEVNEKAHARLNEILLDQFIVLDIKYERASWDVRKGKPGKTTKETLELENIDNLQPFHWGFEFSDVMSRPNGSGGFDAIITNPPWDVFKPNSKEFFEEYSDLVSKKNMSIHDFQKEQTLLLQDAELREAWEEYLSQFPHQSLWFRSSLTYSHQSSEANGRRIGSDLNLYKLFTERCYRLLREGGQCGIITQSGLYTDLGAKGLRELLFTRARIRHLFGLSNEKFLFENVHHAQKFCFLVFSRGSETDSFDCAFRINPREAIGATDLEEFFENAQRHISIDVQLVERMSPESLSIPEFRSNIDVSIAEKVLRYPLLGEDVPDKWSFALSNDFHTTGDSDLYRERQSSSCLPVLEGKMIWQFCTTYGTPRWWIVEKEGRSRLLGRSPDNGQSLGYEVFRLVHRRQAGSTNERTLVAAMSPPMFHVDNLATFAVFDGDKKRATSAEQLFAVALLNSFVVDYTIRQKVTTNLNFFHIYQLAIPRMNAGDIGFKDIMHRAGKLTCIGTEFDALAHEISPGTNHMTLGVTDKNERAQLHAELDAMVAHLYGLTESEFEHILATFPLVDQQVKDDALAEYQRMLSSGEAALFNPDIDEQGPAISEPDQQMRELIAAGESARVEFKSTARWDIRQNQRADHIELSAIKTVAAFLNSEGGTLVIGVTDEGDVHGLADDFKTMSKKQDRDGFELWLMNALLKHFGKDAAAQIAVSFHAIGEVDPDNPTPGKCDVCRVEVKPSPKPRFVTQGNSEIFYARTGNQTQQFSMSEFLAYARQRWPEGMNSDVDKSQPSIVQQEEGQLVPK